VVTQDFGGRGAPDELVGVVIDDKDGDRFYDIGEGLGGVTVTVRGAAGTFSTTTWAAGGYQLALAAGDYTVTFSGGGLDGSVVRQIHFGDANQKLDVLAGDASPAVPAAISGDAQANVLIGTDGDDSIVGQAGADRLSGLGGADLLNGESVDAGFDPAAGQIYRLYQVALGRAPDQAGHMAWTQTLLEGRALTDIAGRLVGSAEFQARYGETGDRDFVTLLYQNALHRAPDAAGLAAWTQALAAGRSRAEVVTGFSESAEFSHASTAGALAFSRAGHQADWTGDVYRLFHAGLGRDPAGATLAGWTDALAHGRPLIDIAAGLTGSAEFQARYGAASDAEFVALLYRAILGRDPADAGLTAWTQALASGSQSRAEAVLNLAESAENVQGTAAALTGFMLGLGSDDRLDGGAGLNVLFGGIGADRFVFAQADGGSDRVAGLEAWDRLQLDGFGYASAAQALSHFHQEGADTLFQDQGTSVTFVDTALAQIHADMLVLG
jgi:Ca2+-binding RTX toxin-like protein